MRTNFLSRFLAAFVVASGALTAHAQTPYLVTDVEPATTSSYIRRPTEITPAGDGLFLFGSTPSGRALLRTDGTGAPTVVRQLTEESGIGAPSELARVVAALDDRVFFTAERGLWISDGTPFGTSMLRAFPSGGPGVRMATVSGTVYFVVDGPSAELWKSDGTQAGTLRVATVSVRSMVAAGSRLFFLSQDNGLWTSDGTEAGTVLLEPGTGSSLFERSFAALGGMVLFTNNAGQLWRTDGTAAGTARVGTVTGGSMFTRRGNGSSSSPPALPRSGKRTEPTKGRSS